MENQLIDGFENLDRTDLRVPLMHKFIPPLYDLDSQFQTLSKRPNLSAMYDGRRDFPWTAYSIEDLSLIAEKTKHLKTNFEVQYVTKDERAFIFGKQAFPGNPELEVGDENSLTDGEKERLEIYDMLSTSGNKILLEKYLESLHLSHETRMDLQRIEFADSDAYEYGFEWHPRKGVFDKEGKRTWKDYVKAAAMTSILIGAAGSVLSHYLIKPVKADRTHVDIDSPLLTKGVTVDGKYTTSDEWDDGSHPHIQKEGANWAVIKMKHDDKYLYTLIEYPTMAKFSKEDVVNLIWGVKDVRTENPTSDHLYMTYQVDQSLTIPNSTVTLKRAAYLYGEDGHWPFKALNVFHPEWVAGLYSSPDHISQQMEPYLPQGLTLDQVKEQLQKPHQIWEIRTPLNGNDPDDVPCNPNGLESQPFHAAIGNVEKQIGIDITDSDWQHPVSYGTLSHSDIPVPEFAEMIALPVAIAGAAVLLRKKRKSAK